MASIQKLDNKKGVSYRVQIRRKGLPNIYKTFLTKKQASLFALKLEDSVKDHQAYSSKLTFDELIESYLSNAYLGTKPQMQRSRLKHWLGILGDKSIIDINRLDIEFGLRCLPEGLSNTTINKYKKLVSVVFNYGIRELGLTDNPTRYIRSLPEKKGRIRYLSDNERERLFKACRASKWNKFYLLVLMAITTGARRGELLSLRWNNLDIDKQTAYVLTSKNGEPKVLPLTKSVIKELERFSLNNSSLIFASEIKPDKPYFFYKQWDRVRKEAELIDFRFHDLRHTTASYLAQSGATLLEIADVLGHKQIEVTKRYAHLCIGHKSSLINRVMGGI
ncbi:tyrosine-type recombinase/integrase [Candidatus Pseudothioglobus sp. Uisw_050_01]|uniref:tyrosine-type recombinase/integrase n=1 Tax=Candidatus Pseudothioglobus sp. Uisw_050_01 TaxID=3230997 RepID=UPI003A875506